MSLGLVLVVVAVLALAGIYLSWTAGRLDRLHNRTNAAWASLDAQLVRRAAAVAEVAHLGRDRGLLKDVVADELGTAAQTALDVSAESIGPDPKRVQVENSLGRLLRSTFGSGREPIAGMTGDAPVAEALVPVLGALDAAMTKVVLARRFHATAVDDTTALRRSRVVRWFRLAGSAPLPAYFDIDDTPASLPISTAARPH